MADFPTQPYNPQAPPPWWWLVGLMALAMFGGAAYLYIWGDGITKSFGGFLVFFGLFPGIASLFLLRDARRKKRANQGGRAGRYR